MPMCRRGTMAFMMEFNTICRPAQGAKHTLTALEKRHERKTTKKGAEKHWKQRQTADGRRTWHSRHQPQRPQHSERSEGFDIQASGLACSVVGLSWLMVSHGFRYHAKQPGTNTQTHTCTVTGALLCSLAAWCGETDGRKNTRQ